MMYNEACGEKLSRLGFGCMRLPLTAEKAIDERELQKMVDYAIDHGVNYFDTAWPYHGGHSEIAIGKALAKYPREKWFLADKYPGHQIASSYNPAEIFEEQLAALLEEKNIGMIVYAGFMLILGPNFVAKYPKRMINVHPALIPSFCGKGMYGLHVHEAALAYGVKVSGATVHYVSEVCDGGEIILQKAVDVLEGDTPETLQKRIMEQAEWVLLPQATELVCARLRGKED